MLLQSRNPNLKVLAFKDEGTHNIYIQVGTRPKTLVLPHGFQSRCLFSRSVTENPELDPTRCPERGESYCDPIDS